MARVALVTGITGQDGSYLADMLLREGYEVHGIVRRSSSTIRSRIDHLTRNPKIYRSRLFLHYADLDDVTTIRRLVQSVQPNEFYHLAGQSHVGASFEIPESTCEFSAMGTLRLLEVVRDCSPIPKFLHISSSEIFGAPDAAPQNEQTPMRPVTPYGVAKAFATNMVRVYRDSFGVFACNAICFNHESPRRGESFVSRKIVRAAAQASLGELDVLYLGNLDGERDWGYAPDFVDAFWRMLQMPEATDIVLATGQKRSVRDWLDCAFGYVQLSWEPYVQLDERLLRRAEPRKLVGDPCLAKQLIDWEPVTNFETMVHTMVNAEMASIRRRDQSE